MKIKFTKDVTTKEAKPQSFKKDQVVDLPDASANHWINRQAAEPVVEEDSDEREMATFPHRKSEGKQPEKRDQNKPADAHGQQVGPQAGKQDDKK